MYWWQVWVPEEMALDLRLHTLWTQCQRHQLPLTIDRTRSVAERRRVWQLDGGGEVEQICQGVVFRLGTETEYRDAVQREIMLVFGTEAQLSEETVADLLD